MTQKIIKYEVVVAHELALLVNRVNEMAIKQGYQPIGGMTVDSHSYYQSVVKYAPISNTITGPR